jgi:hypothetical protein
MNALPDRISELLGNGNIKHYRIVNGTAYSAGMTMKDGTEDPRATPDEVISILEKHRQSDTPVRAFYGDATGRSWLDENDIVGTVRRSGGSIRIPLLIPSDGFGGPGLLDACIIRIDTRRRTLWRHPTFHVPPMEVRVGDTHLDFPYEVFVDGKLHARFPRPSHAARFISLLKGDVFPDPKLEPGAYGLDRKE